MSTEAPSLKRIKVSSIHELNNWLERNASHDGSVMLVTSTKANMPKYISHEQVHETLASHGWISPIKYTLNKTLIGHVIKIQ